MLTLETGVRRFWIYQQERFPILAHGLLMLAFSLSAVCFSSLLRGVEQFPAWPVIAVAFFSSAFRISRGLLRRQLGARTVEKLKMFLRFPCLSFGVSSLGGQCRNFRLPCCFDCGTERAYALPFGPMLALQ
jgi:hypothetical protein